MTVSSLCFLRTDTKNLSNSKMATHQGCSAPYSCHLLVGVVLFLLGVWAPPGVGGEVFSSMAALRSLVSNQGDLINSLEDYLVQEENRLQELRGLVDKMRQDIDYHVDPEEAMLSIQHPGSAYSLIRDWSFLSDRVYDKSSSDAMENRNSEVGVSLPSSYDRLGALNALIRLQRTYNLSIEELASGNVRGHFSHKPLGGRDFFDIGVAAVNKNLPTTALPWLEKSMEHRPDDLPESEVLYQIGQVYSRRSEFGKSKEYFEKAYNLDKLNSTLYKQYQSLAEIVHVHGNNSAYEFKEIFPDWKISYEALCRKDVPQMALVQSDVWCEYQVHAVSYAPYKMEVLHTDPWIVVYYDVISNRETDYLKYLATPELNRAVVGDPAKAYATEERVSKVAWLWDQNGDQAVVQLSRRVQEVTGLQTKYHAQFSNSEPFQVVNYGMGGQYEPHVDVYENKNHLANVPYFLQGMGDRVATFMFYLSDVQEGGATVFPLLNLYVPPLKNAAAFWYNIHRNGSLDLRTQHAGCPVLVGEKWVANKWIRENGQLFRRPCGPTIFSSETESQAATGR